MNLFFNQSNTNDVNKKYFNLKNVNKDGLIIQIHHDLPYRKSAKRFRFLYSAFDATGSVSANADFDGNVFIIDLSNSKYWSLPKLESCCILAFSIINNANLLIGCIDGNIYVINIHIGNLICVLEGHKSSVKSISFSNDQCLTLSENRAIIFSLRSFEKIHQLAIDSSTSMKQMFFMPVTGHILGCFNDNCIHVWQNNTFKLFKKIVPADWNTFNIKSIAITRNGSTMILAGLSPNLILFSLDSWSITKVLSLSSETHIKHAEFISQPHDGGANKYLILLSKAGQVCILDMEQFTIIWRFNESREIYNIITSNNGIYLSCVLKCGDINLYKISSILESVKNNPKQERVRAGGSIKLEENKKLKLRISPVKTPQKNLDLQRLKAILQEFGEYPTSYRSFIWTKILMLPRNLKSYASINNKGFSSKFNYLNKMFPSINKPAVKNLKSLLSNLANWSPIFYHIDFMPLLVFPFVKIFENNPIACFEAVVTIILNFWQHWFEYIPLLPVNVLAMIENVFTEHDPQLLAYFSSKQITSKLYAWSLLEVSFSEQFTAKEWCILWDHILTNDPSFILMIPVAYNILLRYNLFKLNNLNEFQIFYHNQNPVGIKNIISKTYYLLNHTSYERHPKKYLNNFSPLLQGVYPIFTDFPNVPIKEMDNVEGNEMEYNTEDEINNTRLEIKKTREQLMTKQSEISLKEEEAKRLQNLKSVFLEKQLQEKALAQKRKTILSKLKTQLMDLQAETLEKSRNKIEDLYLNKKKLELKEIIKNIEIAKNVEDLDIQKIEEELSKNYVKLLKQKNTLENIAYENIANDAYINEEIKINERQQQILNTKLEELNKRKHRTPSSTSTSEMNYNLQTLHGTNKSETKSMQLLEIAKNVLDLEKQTQSILKQIPHKRSSQSKLQTSHRRKDLTYQQKKSSDERKSSDSFLNAENRSISSQSIKHNSFCFHQN